MENLMTDKSLSKRNNFKRIISFSWITKSLLVEIIAHLFIILFLYTGIAKLMEFDVFQEQLAESPVLEPMAPVVAWGLPITEFVISILLFFPRFRLKGLYASFVMMVLFTAYVITILSIDKELPCSCGGIVEALSWKGHLIFNSVLVLLSFAGIRMQKKLNRQNKVTEDRYVGSHV
jgi:uncharacterized membrane protein YphA (DoxX/SURF4 family)